MKKTLGIISKFLLSKGFSDLLGNSPSKISNKMNDHKLISMKDVLPTYKTLFMMTSLSIGGVINRVDFILHNGLTLKGLKVIDESKVWIPNEYSPSDVKSVSIPFDQRP